MKKLRIEANSSDIQTIEYIFEKEDFAARFNGLTYQIFEKSNYIIKMIHSPTVYFLTFEAAHKFLMDYRNALGLPKIDFSNIK